MRRADMRALFAYLERITAALEPGEPGGMPYPEVVAHICSNCGAADSLRTIVTMGAPTRRICGECGVAEPGEPRGE